LSNDSNGVGVEEDGYNGGRVEAVVDDASSTGGCGCGCSCCCDVLRSNESTESDFVGMNLLGSEATLLSDSSFSSEAATTTLLLSLESSDCSCCCIVEFLNELSCALMTTGADGEF
jgi:hypothetical protein